MAENSESFESRLKKVQGIAERIESGALSLEDSVSQFENGMKELNALEEELKQINRRITVLKTEGDQTVEVPLEEAQ